MKRSFARENGLSFKEKKESSLLDKEGERRYIITRDTDISMDLLEMIKSNLDSSFKGVKGRILADDIKEKLGYLLLTKDDDEMENEENYI